MKAAALLLLLALGLASGQEGDPGRKKGPWFCHGRDCPSFKTVDESSDFSKRCYDRSTWALSCSHDCQMPEGILRARARVLNYVKENDLWGATPFASVVHLSLDAQRALNASLPSPPAGAAPEGAPGLDAAAEAAAVEVAAVEALEHGLHRTVCFAYFLPNRYQAPTPDGGEEELDRRPPRPRRRSGVCVIRIARFEAYVSGFSGFATPPRFIFESLKLAHHLHWHGCEFDWSTGMLFNYNRPSQETDRWNEALIPARRWHDLLAEEGEDVYDACMYEEGEAEVEESVVPQ